MKSLSLNLSLLAFLLCTSSCTFMKVVCLNRPSIYDQKHFSSEVITATNPTNICVDKTIKTEIPPVNKWTKYEDENFDLPLDQFLEQTNSTSFIVMQNDSILYENYFNGNAIDKQNIVFSVTKVFITSLLAIAIEEGFIESVDQYVGEYIDAFNVGDKKRIKIRDVLQMTSGINRGDYRGNYKIGQTYYTSNLDQVISKAKINVPPGAKFEYKSIDTQILGTLIEAATGKEVSDLIYEKIWKPLGMEYDAYFTKDRAEGNERMYGGMAMTSRDILKIGKLYLNGGQWNGQQIIPVDWVNSVPKRTQDNGKWWGYNKGWWMETYLSGHYLDGGDYYASGYQGQYLYIDPAQNLVIVRQGINSGGIRWYAALSCLSKLMTAEEVSTINVVDTPAHFEGNYFAKNGDHMTIKKGNDNKWQVILAHHKKRKKIVVKSHSAFALTAGTKLKLFLFDVKDGVVNGVSFDPSSVQPTYFKKEAKPFLSSNK